MTIRSSYSQSSLKITTKFDWNFFVIPSCTNLIELTWECGEYNTDEVLKVGQTVTVKVINVDEARQWIDLSVDLSQLVYPRRPHLEGCLRDVGQLPGRPVKFS